MMLTPLELEALELSGKLANLLGRITDNGSTRNDDLRELFGHIHVIQRSIMAQAAARTYPTLLRKLGSTVAEEVKSTVQ